MGKSATNKEVLVFDFKQDFVLLLLADLSLGSAQIKSLASFPTEDFLSQSQSSKILDELSHLIDRENPPTAILTWEAGISSRQVILPDLPAQDLEKAFFSEMKSKFSFNPDENLFAKEMVCDYEGEEGGKEKLFNIFYCDKKSAMQKVEAVQRLGFRVLGLVPSQCALASWASRSTASPEDLLLIDIGYQSARIFVARHGKILLSRTVMLGGQILSQMMSEPFLTDSKRMQFNPEEAERIKLSEGVKNPRADYIGLVRPYLEKLVAETKRSVDFYESHKYSSPVKTALFTGGGSNLRGLDAFMTQFLGLKADFPKMDLSLAQDVNDKARDFVAENPRTCLSAFAAASMPEMRINLLPLEIRFSERENVKKISLRLVSYVGAAILVFLIAFAFIRIQIAKAQLKNMELEWRETSRMNDLLIEIINQQQFRLTAMRGDVLHSALWKALSHCVPQALTLEEMEFNRAQGELFLRGSVLSDDRQMVKILAKFIDDLLATPFFKDAVLTKSSPSASGDRSQFEIRCVLRGIS